MCLILVYPDLNHNQIQGDHWSGKSGKFDFSSRSEKSQGILQIGQEILNTKKVREKSGNFIILAQNMCCSRYFDCM